MKISQSQKDNIVVLALEGRLDTLTSSTLQESLDGLINSGQHQILIDCTELQFISSSGLRVLLTAAKQLNSLQGKFALCALKDRIREVFDIAGFTMLFSIFSDVAAALKHF
ncbi:MAG: STAS domain-containing protein [Saprospiraceae bacterium]